MPQSIDDHGDRSQLAPLAGPATEAYNLRLVNVPALDLGSPTSHFLSTALPTSLLNRVVA